MSTGGESTTWWGLSGTLVCINYVDPATMRELKLMLAEVAGVATRVETAVWTKDDEGALALANVEEQFREADLGKWTALGWYIPRAETPGRLLCSLGYPESQRLVHDYPLLTAVFDRAQYCGVFGGEAAVHSPLKLGSTDPRVGAAGTPAPAPPEPPALIPEPEYPGTEPVYYPDEPEVYEEPREATISPTMIAGMMMAVVGVGFAVVYSIRS